MTDRLAQFGPSLDEATADDEVHGLEELGVDINYVDLAEAINWIAFGTYGPLGIGPRWYTGWIDMEAMYEVT